MTASAKHAAKKEGRRAVPHSMQLPDLYLRPIQIEDLKHHERLFSDLQVMRFVGATAGQILSPGEVEEVVSLAVEAWKTRGYGRWSIFSNETHEFIGSCGFRCEEGIPELLCFVFEKHWGDGTARKAVEACLNYGFDKLGFHKVLSFTRSENIRARKLIEKVGAEFTGEIDYHGIWGSAYVIRRPALSI